MEASFACLPPPPLPPSLTFFFCPHPPTPPHVSRSRPNAQQICTAVMYAYRYLPSAFLYASPTPSLVRAGKVRQTYPPCCCPRFPTPLPPPRPRPPPVVPLFRFSPAIQFCSGRSVPLAILLQLLGGCRRMRCERRIPLSLSLSLSLLSCPPPGVSFLLPAWRSLSWLFFRSPSTPPPQNTVTPLNFLLPPVPSLSLSRPLLCFVWRLNTLQTKSPFLNVKLLLF